jgi:hypothetical protein
MCGMVAIGRLADTCWIHRDALYPVAVASFYASRRPPEVKTGSHFFARCSKPDSMAIPRSTRPSDHVQTCGRVLALGCHIARLSSLADERQGRLGKGSVLAGATR